jgi:hypothetical protein
LHESGKLKLHPEELVKYVKNGDGLDISLSPEMNMVPIANARRLLFCCSAPSLYHLRFSGNGIPAIRELLYNFFNTSFFGVKAHLNRNGHGIEAVFHQPINTSQDRPYPVLRITSSPAGEVGNLQPYNTLISPRDNVVRIEKQENAYKHKNDDCGSTSHNASSFF